MQSPVRVLVLGNGYASYCQLPALRWAERHGGPPVEVAAIVARDMKRAQETAARFHIAHATSDLDQAIDKAGAIDLAIVSTPVDLHAAQVARLLERTPATTSILCEKPFTLRVEDARALAERARA